MSSCVHYKFANSKDYATLPFDGLAISLADLRDAVLVQKKMAKSATFILEVVNAQTREEYKGDPTQTMIPRNASVLVRRVPVTKKVLDTTVVTGKASSPDRAPSHTAARLAKTVDLVNTDATEEEKLEAAMKQGTDVFKPSNLPKVQASRGRGRPHYHHRPESQPEPLALPNNYICFRCGEKGHHIRNCPNPKSDVPIHVAGARNRGTGIPSEFLAPATDPNAPGVFRDRSGNLVVPIIDRDAYLKGKKLTKNDFPEGADVPDAPTMPQKEERVVPAELRCRLCKEIMKDAALIPCCGESYCHDCIGDYLIKNGFVCPHCKELSSPDRLSPNAGLRQSIAKFLNTNLQDVPPTPEPGKKKIELRLKSMNTVPTASTGTTTSVSEKDKATPETNGERETAVVAGAEKKVEGGVKTSKSDTSLTDNGDDSTPPLSPNPTDIGREKNNSTPRDSGSQRASRSRSGTPVRSGTESDSERRRKIAKELEQTYQRVAAVPALPTTGLAAVQPVPNAGLLSFVPGLAPLFPTPAALFPAVGGAKVGEAPPLSEEDFYLLRQRLTKGKRRSSSRSRSRTPTMSRSVTTSPSGHSTGGGRYRGGHFSRSPSPMSRSRSPPRMRSRSPPRMRSRSPPRMRTRSPSPRHMYADRSGAYLDRRYDERYRRRSRSPPHSSSADYESYHAWYERHHGRHPRAASPHDRFYRGGPASRHRDDRDRYRDSRDSPRRPYSDRDRAYVERDRRRDERHDERDRYRRRSRSPPPPPHPSSADYESYRTWYERYHGRHHRAASPHDRPRGGSAGGINGGYRDDRERDRKDRGDHDRERTNLTISKSVRTPSPTPGGQPPKKKRRIVELVTVSTSPAAKRVKSPEPPKTRTKPEQVPSPSPERKPDEVVVAEQPKRRHSSHKKKKKKHHRSKKEKTDEKRLDSEEQSQEDDIEIISSPNRFRSPEPEPEPEVEAEETLPTESVKRRHSSHKKKKKKHHRSKKEKSNESHRGGEYSQGE